MKYLKKNSFIIVFSCLFSGINAQVVPLNTISSLTNVLSESSGVTFIAPNRIYTHDDSGGNDEIYELDTLGNLIRTININSANNSDWEDITKDNLQNIYIGDFGNNNNDRTNLRVYKIPSPASFSGNAISAQLIEFHYPDQSMFPPAPAKRNFDAEAFVWFDDSLFIFTKNRTAPFNGYCKMYKIPATPGVHTAEVCDSIFLCGDSQSNCWVTAAALSPDNSHLALLNDSKVWWFSCFNGSAFFRGAMATANLNNNTQKEGITFKNNQAVYITDEFSSIDNSGGKLYEADFNAYLNMPYVNIIPDTIICDNCTVTVDSAVGSLSWDNGSFGPTITPTFTGWYKVEANQLNNCVVSDSVYISYLQGLKESLASGTSLLIQSATKNAINGNIYTTNMHACVIQLTDITGKAILKENISITNAVQHFSLDVNLNNGIYLLHIQEQSAYKCIKVVIAE